MIKIVFIIYDGGSLTYPYINDAMNFINTYAPVTISQQIIYLGSTPPYYTYPAPYFCSHLTPWDIPDTDKVQLPLDCFVYSFFWSIKSSDTECGAGGVIYTTELYYRAMVSIPYNTWYFNQLGNWGHGLLSGTCITIHELHHAIMFVLYNIYGYGIATKSSEHIYGRTIPHLDYMADFGFADGQHYDFTVWAYQQLTATMWSKLEEFCANACSVDLEQKCFGSDLLQCQQGQWVLIEKNARICKLVPAVPPLFDCIFIRLSTGNMLPRINLPYGITPRLDCIRMGYVEEIMIID